MSLLNYEIRDSRKNLSNRASGSKDSFVSFQNIKIVQQMNRIMFERISNFLIIKCNRFISFLLGKDIICVFKISKILFLIIESCWTEGHNEIFPAGGN